MSDRGFLYLRGVSASTRGAPARLRRSHRATVPAFREFRARSHKTLNRPGEGRMASTRVVSATTLPARICASKRVRLASTSRSGRESQPWPPAGGRMGTHKVRRPQLGNQPLRRLVSVASLIPTARTRKALLPLRARLKDWHEVCLQSFYCCTGDGESYFRLLFAILASRVSASAKRLCSQPRLLSSDS
jgi:hypothetical protein